METRVNTIGRSPGRSSVVLTEGMKLEVRVYLEETGEPDEDNWLFSPKKRWRLIGWREQNAPDALEPRHMRSAVWSFAQPEQDLHRVQRQCPALL